MNISVVLPVFNEEKNIKTLYKRLKATLDKISKSHEIIFVNDASTDKSFQTLKKLRKKDRKIKIISFSRNFGHMAAVSAGLRHSTGKKVVVMDSDLQDPPEVIKKLYKKAQNYDVVFAVKKKRKESTILRAGFAIFYWLQSNIATLPIPSNAGTFSIMDRKVVNIIKDLPERNKFFSGLRFWTGYTQKSITYERGERKEGKRKSLLSLIKLALDGIFSFSYLPLRLASILGLLTASLAFVFIIFVVILRVFFGFGLIGWASTMSAVLLFSGVQLITLGIIGEYLARIYDEVKGRPEYIISEKLGFSKKP